MLEQAAKAKPRNQARLAIGAGLAALLLVGSVAVALAARSGPTPQTSITIEIKYSKFNPSAITVPIGVPVRITLINADPIDHEWIIGDEAVQAFHRTSAEPLHPSIPSEQFITALSTRVTTITFDQPGELKYICHLPAHEAYGMVGVATIIR